MLTYNIDFAVASAKKVNDSLKQTLPGYKNLNDVAIALCGYSTQKAEGVIVYAGEKWNQTGGFVYQKGRKIAIDAQGVIQKKTGQILSKVEDALQVNKEKSGELAYWSSKDRIIGIFLKLNYYFLLTTQNFKRYSSQTIQQGRQMVFTYSMPIYITLKATVLVTKEMIFEMLENRIQNMKVTYEASKDTVTMLIGGKFNEEQIKAKISQGIQSFKELKVKVVQKGLEINIDAKTLRENYDIFAIKFLEIIKNMKQKGAQNIISAKQGSINLYNEIINRIKQKQRQIKIDYSQKKRVQ